MVYLILRFTYMLKEQANEGKHVAMQTHQTVVGLQEKLQQQLSDSEGELCTLNFVVHSQALGVITVDKSFLKASKVESMYIKHHVIGCHVCAYSYWGLIHLPLTYTTAGILTQSDFRKVYKELLGLRGKWRLIGLELGLEWSELNNIELDYVY